MYIDKLTVNSMHWFSMIAPQHPKNPMINIRTPEQMHKTVALRKLKLGASDAYDPLDT